jgi:hypothetical protein
MKTICISNKNLIDTYKILANGEKHHELRLHLSVDYNLKNIPEHITNLTLSSKKHVKFCDIPINIKELNIKYSCGELEQDVFFNTQLRYIDFLRWNQMFGKNFFPQTLKILKLGIYFNQPLSANTLPNNLEELYFGNKFDQSIIENVLPDTLVKIVFGRNFNKKLYKKVLPKNLLELDLGGMYNFNISNELPDKLEKLYLSNDFNSEIYKDALPKNLHTLKFKGAYSSPLGEKILPDSLKILYLSTNCNGVITREILSPNLEELHYEIHGQMTNSYMKKIKIISLPLQLKKLTIRNLCMELCDDIFVESIEKINLEILKFYKKDEPNYDTTKILLKLPSNLKKFRYFANSKTYDFLFPIGLETLKLINYYYYNKQKILKLPATLKKLEVHGIELETYQELPEELETLIVWNELNIQSLPPNLKEIIFSYHPSIVTTNLPMSLERIKVPPPSKKQYCEYMEKYKKLFSKMPFGCNLVDYENKIIL